MGAARNIIPIPEALAELQVAPGQICGNHDAHERVIMVLEGAGTETSGPVPMPFAASTLLYLPPRSPYEFLNTGSDFARLLVLAAPAAPESAPSVGSPFGPISWRELPSRSLGSAAGFFGVSSTLAVTAESAGSSQILFGVSRFAPGGRHEIHRHLSVAEVMYVIDGDDCRLIGDGGWTRCLRAGESTWTAPGEWHGLLNTGETTATVAFAYLGAASTETDGYELYGA